MSIKIKFSMPEVLLKSTLMLLIIFPLLTTLPQETKAATLAISGLSQDSISTGDALIVSGSNLMNQNTANWDWPEAEASFEGAGHKSDGWTVYYDTGVDYVKDVALFGNQSSRSTFDLVWGGTVRTTDGKLSGAPHCQRYFTDADVKWYRTYVRFSENFWWPDNYYKVFYLQRGNGAISARFGNGPNVPRTWHLHGNAPDYALVPQMYHERWYCCEFKRQRVDLGGDQYNVIQSMWLDGDFVGSATVGKGWPDAEVRSWDLGCASAASYKEADLPIYGLARWHDGAVTGSTRIYPAAIVEIGDSSDYSTATKVKQELLHIADDAIKFKANLAGIGSGPYYLWVTNNGQERSAAYLIGSAVPDANPPSVSNLSPLHDATNIPISTNISFHIQDSGDGVDINNLQLTVGSEQISKENLQITGDSSNYAVVYDPPADFGYDTVITVSIDAKDLHNPPNVMSPYTWSFTTESLPAADTNPPTTTSHIPSPNSTGIPVNNNISFHVLDSGDGVDTNSIRLTINGQQVPHGDLEITGSTADYAVVYDPPADFDYNSVITVLIDAQDLHDPSNVMTTYNYSFTTQSEPSSNIILQDDFQSGNINNWLDDAKVGNFIVQNTTVHSGEYALQNSLIKDAHDTGWLSHFFADHPLGPNGNQEDEVCLEWYAYFSPGFVWPSDSVKMFIMAAFESWSAGYPPFNSWSPYYLTVAVDGNGLPFAILNRKTSGSTLWRNMPQNQGSPTVVNPGQWYKLKYHLKLNTPGNSDGICEVWINDQLKVKYTDVNYRDSYTRYGWNHLMITASATPVSPQNQEMYWDDIVLSVGSPWDSPPAPPTDLTIIP